MAAWRLFYEQGYEDTTIDDIVEASETSKGSFYHYFSGKDSLISTLSIIFDEKYQELEKGLNEDMSSLDKLLFLNEELFGMIENSISMDLLTRLLSSQLVSPGESQLVDKNRYYYKLLRKIITEGQNREEFTRTMSASELLKLYALQERALLYDWCLCRGEYSLRHYSMQVLRPLLRGSFLKENE